MFVIFYMLVNFLINRLHFKLALVSFAGWERVFGNGGCWCMSYINKNCIGCIKIVNLVQSAHYVME